MSTSCRRSMSITAMRASCSRATWVYPAAGVDVGLGPGYEREVYLTLVHPDVDTLDDGLWDCFTKPDNAGMQQAGGAFRAVRQLRVRDVFQRHCHALDVDVVRQLEHGHDRVGEVGFAV